LINEKITVFKLGSMFYQKSETYRERIVKRSVAKTVGSANLAFTHKTRKALTKLRVSYYGRQSLHMVR